jgi:dihydroneopterin aldolase
MQEEQRSALASGHVVHPAALEIREVMFQLARHARDSVSRSSTLAAVDESAHPSVEVEVRGLSIYTHHGVSDAEQEVGQRLEFDLTFDVPDCDAVLTDRVEDTVDYSEVCDIVALAATERSYRTLERLCHVVAERLMERFDCDSVQVRAAKPEPPVPYPVQEAGVEVTLERSLDREPDDEEGV